MIETIENAMREGPSIVSVIYVGGEFRAKIDFRGGTHTAVNESLGDALLSIAKALEVE